MEVILLWHAIDSAFYFFGLFVVFLFAFFSGKTSLDISCESSAKQTIHMKYQELFSLKIKKK